ncbi:hypothetical protein DIPPA_23550 [Diplonema papillatum]|nr:hypothetical protein DIPPA_23550 [Diplonema papillatum]
MWEWLAGGSTTSGKVAGTDRQSSAQKNGSGGERAAAAPASLDGVLRENSQLRHFNSKLLVELRGKDHLLQKMQQTLDAANRALRVLKQDASDKDRGLARLRGQLDELRKSCEPVQRSSPDLEHTAAYVSEAIVEAEQSGWDTIRRLHALMLPGGGAASPEAKENGLSSGGELADAAAGISPAEPGGLSRCEEEEEDEEQSDGQENAKGDSSDEENEAYRSPTHGMLAPTILAPLPPTTKKYCIILDIDETQVHFCLESFPARKAELRFRAGVEEALQRLCRLKHTIELGLWTAGVPRYAIATRELLSMVAREASVFDWTIARHRSWSSNGVKKDLSTLGRSLDDVLLIDNARKVVVQKTNSLVVTDFYSTVKGARDNTLSIVVDLVEELVASNLTVPDFLEKKSHEGSVVSHGGYFLAPTSWSSELVLRRQNGAARAGCSPGCASSASYSLPKQCSHSASAAAPDLNDVTEAIINRRLNPNDTSDESPSAPSAQSPT